MSYHQYKPLKSWYLTILFIPITSYMCMKECMHVEDGVNLSYHLLPVILIILK